MMDRSSSACGSNFFVENEPNLAETEVDFNIQGTKGDVETVVRGQALHGNLGTWSYDPQRARDQLALYIAQKNLPINLGDDEDFKEFIRTAYQPKFRVVSRNTTRNDIMRLFHAMRDQLVTEFGSFHAFVACTSDIWTGCNRVGYICVTAHYIDQQCQFQKRLIGFRKISFPHDAQTIYAIIMNVFEFYGIKDKILSLTFDNACASNAAITLFERTIRSPVGGRLIHQRCACHIINLMVQEGFKQFNVYLNNVRDAITYIGSSGARIQEFEEACRCMGLSPRRLPTDMPTRWNTTYLMLDACLPYKDVINAVYNAYANNFDGGLTETDWVVCNCFYYFLKVFYDATICLSGIYYPTTHQAIHKLYGIAVQFEMHRDVEIFTAVVEFMEAKFKKYWQQIPPIYCIAAVLDPRIKLTGVDQLIRSIAEKLGVDVGLTIDDVRIQLEVMYRSYHDKFGATSCSSGIQAGRPSVSSTSSNRSSWMAILRAPGFIGHSSSSSRSELENYYDTDFSSHYIAPDGTLETDDFDILVFWREQGTLFPVLSRMARDVLTIPVSTVASEHLFSQSGRVLEEQRFMLSEDILEALMCLKDWQDARRRRQYFEDDLVADFQNFEVGGTSYAGGASGSRS